MLIKIFDDAGVETFSYDTTHVAEQLMPAVEKLPAIRSALQEANRVLPIPFRRDLEKQ